jgi:phosphatidylinositol alpha-1,6-mannosyltransferase
MRLLIVTFDPPRNVGGIEGRAVHYTHELVARGVHVAVVAFAPDYEGATEKFEGTTLHKLSSSPTRIRQTLTYVVRLISREAIDSVFLLSGGITLFGCSLLAYCRLTGLNSMVFFYGKDLLTVRGRPISLLVLVTGILAYRIAANSVFTTSLLPYWMGTRAKILYPAVDPSAAQGQYPPGSVHGKTVLFVGRLVERKGLDTLLAAFKRLLERIPGCRLEIVGDGPAMAKLRMMIEDLGLVADVEVVGALRGDALYRRFAASDVFVLPSRTTKDDTEGFGTVFLEAGLFGKPVIGTRSGGIPEAVVDGVTGLLVAEDSPQELCDSMFRILSDEDIASNMGLSGRDRALKRFSWNRVTTDLQSSLTE